MENKCIRCEGSFKIPYCTVEEGQFCSKVCYDSVYIKPVENPMKDIVIDLVTLAIKANDVVIKGNFSGSMADEVNSLLKMCKEIHDEYVELSE